MDQVELDCRPATGMSENRHFVVLLARRPRVRVTDIVVLLLRQTGRVQHSTVQKHCPLGSVNAHCSLKPNPCTHVEKIALIPPSAQEKQPAGLSSSAKCKKNAAKKNIPNPSPLIHNALPGDNCKDPPEFSIKVSK